LIETYTSGGSPVPIITPNTHMMRYSERTRRKLASVYITEKSIGKMDGNTSAFEEDGSAD